MEKQIQRFEDLPIFQQARQLCIDVYKFTDTEPWKYDKRFVQQIHASAGSVMDNIAEGFEREGNKEFINFLYIAKGSCGEVRSQGLRAMDVNFINKDNADKLYNDCIALSKGIYFFIQSIKKSGMVGAKYTDLNP